MSDGSHMRDWFSDAELEPCPSCCRRSVLATPGVPAVICLDCGVVSLRADPDGGTQP